MARNIDKKYRFNICGPNIKEAHKQCIYHPVQAYYENRSFFNSWRSNGDWRSLSWIDSNAVFCGGTC